VSKPVTLLSAVKELRTFAEGAGFRPLYGLWDGRFLGWVRSITPGSGVYAYIHAYRPKSNADCCDFWVAPAGCLGNDFTSTSIAAGGCIGVDWNNADSFFARCSRKIGNLMSGASALETAVLKEWEAPSHVATHNSDSSLRDEKYLAELALLGQGCPVGMVRRLPRGDCAFLAAKGEEVHACHRGQPPGVLPVRPPSGACGLAEQFRG